MNTGQITEIIKKDSVTRRRFGGVYAVNQLPHSMNVYPCGYIANTDPSSKPGEHWVAFYFTTPERGEFFDSYGHPPEFYNVKFLNFLNRNCKQWSFNNKGLQSALTAVCGEYCILYLMHRARGVSMSKIVNVFTENKLHNDQQVLEFVMKYV